MVFAPLIVPVSNADECLQSDGVPDSPIQVDVERGRTVKSWLPRKLGGGLGGTRRGAPHECIKTSGRVEGGGGGDGGSRRDSHGGSGGYSDRRYVTAA